MKTELPLDVSELARGFAGRLILRNDAEYDDARRIFNGMIDRRPAVIARCANPADVAAAIAFARQRDLKIAVRCGGHGVSGKSLVDDGLVIDLRLINDATVDAQARTVTVGGGAIMGELNAATQPHGLATASGRVSTTGVGGYTLGGGDGWIARKTGLACDNLLAAELVTADGTRLRASEDENPDLFWALHGGGGNFGVVTSFTFRLHEIPTVTAGLLFYPPEQGPRVMRAYREFMQTAPDELGGAVAYLTGPDEPFMPREIVGKLALLLLVAYTGPEAEAREVAAPLLSLGHTGEMIAEMPHADFQCMLDDPPGYRNYWSVEYLESLPDEAIEVFCAQAQDMIVPSISQYPIFPQGGAIARGPSEYPIPWRHAPWAVHPFGVWENPADDERGRRWTKNIRERLQPWASGAVYLNFIGEEGRDRIVAGLGRENYERLARVKAQYDPDNVFHLNHNIKPAGK